MKKEMLNQRVGGSGRLKAFAICATDTREELSSIFELCEMSEDMASWKDSQVQLLIVELTIKSCDDSLDVLKASKAVGLRLIGWYMGGKEGEIFLGQYRDFLDYLVIRDSSVFKYCITENYLPPERVVHLPGIVDFERHNPLRFYGRMDNVFCRYNEQATKTSQFTKWEERVISALDAAYEVVDDESTRNYVLYTNAISNPASIDPMLLDAIADNKNILVAVEGEEYLYFKHLIGVANSKESAIAYFDVLRENPLRAARQRSAALRVLVSNFSPQAIRNHFGRVFDTEMEEEPQVIVVAHAELGEDVQRVLEVFNRQTLPNKQLLLSTNTQVKQKNVICVLPGVLAEKGMEAFCDKNDYVGVFSLQNAYGPCYLEDLYNAVTYSPVPFLQKGNRFQALDRKVLWREGKEYTIVDSFTPSRGIVSLDVLSDEKAFLRDESLRVETLCIDSFHFAANAGDYPDGTLELCMDIENTPTFKRLEAIVGQSVSDEDSKPDKKPEKHVLAPGIFLHKESRDCIQADRVHGITIQVDTGASIRVINPTNYSEKRNHSKSQQITYFPQLDTGIEYEVSCDIRIDGELSIDIVLMIYDDESQLIQFTLEEDRKKLRVKLPPGSRYVIPLLRLQGAGSAIIGEIIIKKRVVEDALLSDFIQQDPALEIIAHNCDYEEGTYKYLSPSGIGLEEFDIPPVKSYYDFVPGVEYQFICERYVELGAMCIPMLIIFDDKTQIDAICIRKSESVTFRMPDNACKIAPVLRMSGVGKVVVRRIALCEERPQGIMELAAGKTEYLVLANQYPSAQKPYANMFVHTRVKEYIKAGLQVSVYLLKGAGSMPLEAYEYDGVRVLSGGGSGLAAILKNNPVKKILVHFVAPHVWSCIQENKAEDKCIMWLHGAESYPANHRLYSMFNYREAARHCTHMLPGIAAMKEIVENKNITLVPVSKALEQDIETHYGELAPGQVQVIPNYVDTKAFHYIRKNAEQRFRIVSVKSYITRVYAGDLLADVILRLAEKDCFEKMEFTLYGKGELFYSQLEPVSKFQNVKIYRSHLHQNELAPLYQDHGIVLIPTRHDTHGISRDEAMACGAVPVTNRVGGVPEFVDDSCGFLANPEDTAAMTDFIAHLADHPDEFLQYSANAAQKVRNTTGYSHTLAKEITLISGRDGQEAGN